MQPADDGILQGITGEKEERKVKCKIIYQLYCPWCGCETLEFIDERAFRQKLECKSFQRKCKLDLIRPATVALALICVASVLYCWFWGKAGELRHYYFVGVLPLVFYMVINASHYPMRRIQTRPRQKERSIGRANIRWYSVKEGGVGLAKLRIIDNMIFPVCFLDATGKPVSQTVCVRLHKRGSLFWRKAKVKIISEDLWKADSEGKTPWEKAEKFVIFNNKEIVGEGRI